MGIRIAVLPSLAALMLFAGTSHTQIPPGARVTIGEMYAQDIARIATELGEYAGAKNTLERELADARQAFFASLDNPAQRKTTEARFARLLYGKDLTLLIQQASEGPTQRNQAIQDGLALMAGGQLDGGIPYNAAPYFNMWLQGVRISLGAKRPGQMVVPASTQVLARAIADNRALYERYKAQRDLAEFARHHGTPAAVQTLAADASLPLAWQEFTTPQTVTYRSAMAPTQQSYDALLEAGRNDPKALMRCVYGPAVFTTQQNKPGVALHDFHFWHARLPANFDQIQAADQAKGAFRDLGSEALDRCPTSLKAAEEFLERARKGYQASRPAVARPSPQQAAGLARRQIQEAQALRERHHQERSALNASFNPRQQAARGAGNQGAGRAQMQEARRQASAELSLRQRREVEELQQRHRREAGQ